MNDEVDSLGCCYANLEESRGAIGANQHGEFLEQEDPDGVLVRVQDVAITDAVLACAVEDDRPDTINIT